MIPAVRILTVFSMAATTMLFALPTSAQQLVTPAAPPSVAVPVAPAAAPAAAAEPAKPEIKVSATKVDPTDPDAIVCKTDTNTGSRIASTKRCQSRRQWTEQSREMQKALMDKPSPANGN